MIPRTLFLALLAYPVYAAAVASGQTIDGLAQARALAIDGNHAAAIAQLRERLAVAPADDDARLLLGTVLSWGGSYDEARTLLEQVVAARPADTDALGALLNVQIWSGRPREAKALAQQGLELAPHSTQFLQGRQRAVDAIDRLRPWEVSASESYDWFSDRRTSWRERQISVRRATPAGSIIVRGSRAERFGLADSQLELEMYPRFRAGTYAYVSAGWAPNERLYPEYRYAADLFQSLGAGFEGSLGYRRLGFSSKTDIYVATLNKYVGNWLLASRLFYVPDRTGATSRSYHGALRRYFGADGTSFVGARYSRGSAREEVRNLNDFEVLGSNTVAGEVSTALGGRFHLGVSGSTSDQERVNVLTLRQHSLSAALSVRF